RQGHSPRTVAEYKDSMRYQGAGYMALPMAIKPTKANPHALTGELRAGLDDQPLSNVAL
ncbi:hypothetical protein ALQ39_02689, partial [Pseudomonas amygdali pv. eriobotryae]